MRFNVIFYQTSDGKIPVEEFLSKLDSKLRAKTVYLLEILQEKGTKLREPYTKHLDDGIFELRCKLGSNLTRTLYFFYTDGNIVITNGFLKKSAKTPRTAIITAKKYRADFISRQEDTSCAHLHSTKKNR